MQTKTPSDELLRRLSTSAVPIEDADCAEARRGRIVARLAELVPTLPARRRQRRRVMGAMALCSAAALAMTLGFAAARYRSPARGSETPAVPSAVLALEGSVQIVHRSAEVAALPLERVAVGNADEVVTGAMGRARASLASGAEVDIDPDSRVRLHGGENDGRGTAALAQGGAEGVTLSNGRVAVRVPKLGPTRSFAVATPEATIVVHGTAFSVERTTGSAGEAPRTRVEVNEGSVAVRRNGVEVVLQAGDRWSSAAPSQGAEADEAKAGEVAANGNPTANKPKFVTGRGAGASSAKNTVGASGSDKSSSLAAENGLLQTAMAARQQGDPRRASELAGELVKRYPASPLVEEARVERMRALAAAGGPAAAESEARSYLADYPRGFARQEANRILGSMPR